LAPESRYCIKCGSKLEAGHRFCWNCGSQRWTPEQEPQSQPQSAERPSPDRPELRGRTAGPRASLGLLPWFYGAGAIFFLVWATQALAVFLSPVGRAQLAGELGRQGVPLSMRSGLLVANGVILISAALVAAALHGAAFHGLRRHRRWGWIAAVVVAAVWSLLIVGIPVLVRLLSRDVRQSFGVE
jgi:hypothetical protein